MKILLSFCNTLHPTGFYEKFGLSPLAIFDSQENKIYFIKIPQHITGNGITGITIDDNFIYAITQSKNKPELLKIDHENFQLITSKKLNIISDPHSILIANNHLLVCSTGTNSIEVFDTKNLIHQKTLWQHPNTEKKFDQVHLNSIFFHKNQLWASCFGRKKGEKWSSAKKGYVINTNNNIKKYKIHHPHSATSFKKQIFYCESAFGKIYCGDKSINKFSNTYVRGLKINTKFIVAGTSTGRKKSKSTGTINTSVDTGHFIAKTGILIINKKNKQYQYFDFSNFGTEIFDLIITKQNICKLNQNIVGINKISDQTTGIPRENILISQLKNNETTLTKKIKILEKKISKLNKKHTHSQLLLKKRTTEINKITASRWFRLWRFYHKIKKNTVRFFLLFPKLLIIVLYFLFTIFFFSTSFIIRKITQLRTKPLKLKPAQQKLDGVSFIIPTWNKKKMVVDCLSTLINHLKQETSTTKTEIIIIDNGSIDHTSAEIQKIKSTKNIIIKLISLPQNLGFAKAINLGAKKAKYNYIYLLNNDMFVQSKFFGHITNFAKKLIKNNQKFFTLSSQVFFADPNKRRQESGKTYTKYTFGFLYIAHLVKKINLKDASITSYAGGGSSLINKHLFLKLGGYDYKSYTPMYCEDVDCSFNAWKLGYPSIFVPQSRVIHNHQSSSKNLNRKPEFYMQKNYLTFILKNLNSSKLILHHIFLYPILMLLDKKYIEYAILNLKNILPILRSQLKLSQFQVKYTDKQLINFLNFETTSNVKL